MIAARHLLATLGLSAAVALTGCSHHTAAPTVSGAEAPPSEPTPAPEKTHGSMEVQAPAGDLAVTGHPVSPDPVAVENQDARAGELADRTGANPDRIPDIEIRNLSRDGNIWIGGEPTDKGYRQVHERGVTAIVDLRNPTPVQRRSAETARQLGLDYINLPIDPRKMDPEKASAFLAFMRQHAGQQVLIHCGSANRASAMYAVYLGAVKGLPTDDAIQRARRTGLKEPEIEQDVRRYLDERAASRPAE